MESSVMGLKNRKRLIRLCEKYGLKGTDIKPSCEVVIRPKNPTFSIWNREKLLGRVTYEELRFPDWTKLEDFVVSLSVSTGAWLE